MKMTKHLCVMLAAAGLFACSNEEIPVDNNAPVAIKGPAALTLKLNTGELSRATEDNFTTDGTAAQLSALTIKFIGGTGDDAARTVSISNGETEQTIYNVPEGTTGIVVVANNNDGDVWTSDAATETGKGANVTCYGICNTLTPAGSTVGTASDDSDYSTTGNSNTTYSKYTAEVTIKPVVARLEIGSLTFDPNEPSDFTSLTLEGVFLNDYYNVGTFTADGTDEKITPSDVKGIDSNPTIADPEKPEDALSSTFALADWFATQTGSDETGESFYTGSTTPALPADSKVWAYNFFVDAANAEHSLPKFTVVLNPTYAAGTGYGAPLYAVIKEYKVSGVKIDKFEAGKIYKIESLSLPEDVLTPDINGNQTIAVTANITVQPWTIQQTTGVWEGQN